MARRVHGDIRAEIAIDTAQEGGVDKRRAIRIKLCDKRICARKEAVWVQCAG
jgi:hypothetical protein